MFAGGIMSKETDKIIMIIYLVIISVSTPIALMAHENGMTTLRDVFGAICGFSVGGLLVWGFSYLVK